MMDTLETHYLNMKEDRLAYCEHGAGPDLLLLHGNSQSKRTFRRFQLEHFSAFHTIAVDTPGHGESTCHSGELCYAGCCDAACCLCEQLGIRDGRIIGYSDGANIALLMAKKAPRLLEKAVLISPNYRVSGMAPGTVRSIRFTLHVLNMLGRLGIRFHKVSRRMAMMLEDLPIDENDLHALRTDFLILYAEKDVVRERHIQELAGSIPGAGLQQIPHCNHLSILQQAETIALMQQFLAA